MRKYARKKRKDRWGNRFALISITCVVASLAVVVHLRSSSLREKEMDYMTKEENLQQMVDNENNRAALLEEKRVYVQTKQYIEHVAKEKLGLVNPDEIILKPEN